MTALLEIRDLHVTVRGQGGEVPAVRGLSFQVDRGQILAVVGESGAGKSLTAQAVLGLLGPSVAMSGSVKFDGRELAGATQAAYRELRGRRLGFVPQDALSVLSPVHPVGEQLALAVRSVQGASRAAAWDVAVRALDRVGIPDASRRARVYPHEYSGGMRQRAVIAMAMVNQPDLIIADEPTTALDPRLQAQILGLLTGLRDESGTAVVLVTHDLAAVAGSADRVLIMYAGREVESGPVDRVLVTPRSPYAVGLLASLKPMPAATTRRLPAIAGAPPRPQSLPPGCAFAPRCPLAVDECRAIEPEPLLYDGRLVACHRAGDVPAAELAELYR
ncbi:peptide ABC transporter ATP-binding protein [Kribbella sp. ALI-6-A]|uniref:ABC transporter ATP-binding protein n=1 Tax=Kribbella sp. ALI-6-A TaxID=1933817 RepID=UPI00097BC894|nr:ABC transporter ATP-binding protein [Kribbella sp. ALI-6-A]ONI73997.1 peptide ABC transporter ATP-binding protein [Kribbella sp. ALI-6-A]